MKITKENIGDLIIRRSNAEVYRLMEIKGKKVKLEECGGVLISFNLNEDDFDILPGNNLNLDQWEQIQTAFFWNKKRCKKRIKDGYGTGIFASKSDITTINQAIGIDNWAEGRSNVGPTNFAVIWMIKIAKKLGAPRGSFLDLDSGEFIKDVEV